MKLESGSTVNAVCNACRLAFLRQLLLGLHGYMEISHMFATKGC